MDRLATLPVLALSGAHGEMGVEYGGVVPELISRNLEDYLRRFRDVLGLSSAEVLRWGGIYRSVTHGYSASIGETLEGIAEGSGQRPKHVFALNARTEIIYSVPAQEEGCTSLAVLPSRTESGHALLGTNWDWHPEQGDVTLLVATREPDGFTMLSLTVRARVRERTPDQPVREGGSPLLNRGAPYAARA